MGRLQRDFHLLMFPCEPHIEASSPCSMARDVGQQHCEDLCLGYWENPIYTLHLLPEETESRRLALATAHPSGQYE